MNNRKPKNKTFKQTIDLLHRITKSNTQSELNKEHISDLVHSVEPFIYGGTPMCKVLASALTTFENINDIDKVLFLLTDGEATDGDPSEFISELEQKEILVFVCLLTHDDISHPRKLYYKSDDNWSDAHKKMFELSSTVSTTHSGMTILLENGWELPSEGACKLCIQANHPDVIDDFRYLFYIF